MVASQSPTPERRPASRRWVWVVVTVGLLTTAGFGGECTAQELPPALAECLTQGHAALQKGDMPTAAKNYEECLKKFPDSKLARYWLANAHYFMRDTEKAIAGLKELVRRDPEDVPSLHLLGRIYSFDPAKASLARDLLEKAVALRPDLDDAYFDLARVYAAQGDAENCYKSFATTLAGAMKYALYRTELARILITAGNRDAARRQLQQVLSQAPRYKPAQELLASLDKENPSQEPATPQGASPAQPDGSLKSRTPATKLPAPGGK